MDRLDSITHVDRVIHSTFIGGQHNRHQLQSMFSIHQFPQRWSFPNQRSSSHPPKSRTLISSTLNPANDAVSAGRIKRLVLTPEGRTKLNPNPDREFYAYPRFVTHVDDNFISNLRNLYAQILRPEMEILDLMSSWVSHLPEQVAYKKVVGHGLNAQELARNPRFDRFFVKDLNGDQQLETADSSYDAVLCTVSVQYLQQPEKVFAEVYRVLRPGGVFVVSFSNRLFYEKAIAAWRDGTGYTRVQLVVQYFQCVEGFTEPQVIRKLPNAKEGNSILSRIGGMLGFLSPSDPFYALIAYRNFKPL